MEEKTRKTYLRKLTWLQLLLAVLYWLPPATCVTLEGNVYQDVYVALSPDLPESECETTVTNVEALLNEASALLFAASGNRVQFPSSVQVILPSSYGGCGTYPIDAAMAPIGYSYQQAPLRIGQNHSLFGESMWTQQPRQCGQRGDFIYFTPDILQNDTSAARQLVKEWAKFRWGIMEEVGHEGDYVYPPAYPTTDGTFSPTVCVDTPLTVNELDCTSEQYCSYSSELNDNQTSSLLSVPDLPNVTEMCNTSTHDSQVPTKQNALCSGLSADEVFQQHSDYTATPQESINSVPPVTMTVAFENPVISSLVVLVEYTEDMEIYTFEFEYVVDAVCQSLRAYIQDGVNFGLLLFNNAETTSVWPSGLVKLNSATKENICTDLEALFKASTAPASGRSLAAAINDAAQMLPSSGGSVLLLTKPLSAGETEDVATVVTNAGVNTVWPLLYPYDKQDLSWYETLSTMTGSDKVRSVSTSLNGEACQVIMREQLSQNMVEILTLNQQDQLQNLSSENCLIGADRKCSMSHTIDQSTAADTYLVSVYYSDTLRSVTLDTSLDCQKLNKNDIDTSETYSCSSLPASFSIGVQLVEEGQTVYSDVVGKNIFNSSTSATVSGEGIVFWTSDDLRDLQFRSTSAPAVFVQVYVEGRQAIEASVVAKVTQLNSSASIEILTLTLRDNGVGADVTGNDGIYSSFISFSSGNNSDAQPLELSFEINATAPAYFMPNETVDPPISCCGSLLPLPLLTRTPDFALSTTARGRVTTPPPNNLPPGRITDLKAATISGSVRLSFTAPGADLDVGTVSSYLVRVVPSDEGVASNHSITSGIVPAGSTQVLELSANTIGCGVPLSYVVTASDEQSATSDPSNIVTHENSCYTDVSLSAGAIIGIVIGVLILFLLILLILYLACNWKRRDELSLWRCLTCDNSPQEKSKSKKDNSPVLPSSKRLTNVQIIKNIDDLYTKSDKSVKKTKSGVSNAGFDATPATQSTTNAEVQSSHQRKGSLTSYGSRTLEKYNMPYDLRDSTLQTTLPINKVGIPVPGVDTYDQPKNPFVTSTRSSPSPSQLPTYPNYNSDSGMYETKVKHTESLPEYATYNRSSPYSDTRPASASSLATTKSNLNTLV